MKIQDLRGQTMGGASKRNTSQIKKIARHHSATTSGTVFVFERHWRTLGWNTGGYHEVILRDGTVQICYDPTVVTNGVRNHNTTTYHICLVGNGSFTKEQEDAFEKRALLAMERFKLKVSDVLGHREFPGAATACPGIDMNVVRRNLQSYLDSKKEVKGNTHTVRSGETLSHIASLYKTTVKAIADLNNIRNVNLIRVGQALQLPGQTKKESGPVYYTVRRGDTLGHIAARNKTNVRQLQAWNNIGNANLIRIGQRLRVK